MHLLILFILTEFKILLLSPILLYIFSSIVQLFLKIFPISFVMNLWEVLI